MDSPLHHPPIKPPIGGLRLSLAAVILAAWGVIHKRIRRRRVTLARKASRRAGKSCCAPYGALTARRSWTRTGYWPLPTPALQR